MSTSRFECREHASLYSRYRPTYPDTVFSTIMTYFKGDEDIRKGKLDLAVDVGCGNGQSTFALAQHFRIVIGVDISAEQIAATESTETISFRKGPAEDLNFLEYGTVDLITAAQAIHWFDHERFFKEAIRVLRPNGVLAVYGYGLPKLDNVHASPLVTEFYYDLLQDHWERGTAEAIDMQKGLQIPLQETYRHEAPDLAIEKKMDIDEFVGYMSTSSAWRSYLKDHPESDYMAKLKTRLDDLYRPDPDHQTTTITVSWPVFIIVGRQTDNVTDKL